MPIQQPAAGDPTGPSLDRAPASELIHCNTVTTNRDDIRRSVKRGVERLVAGQFVAAERDFLEALHTVVDEDMELAIIEASKLPPDDAREAVGRLMELQQREKAGPQYLLALALHYQGKVELVLRPLTTAVQSLLGWLYDRSMMIDCEDAHLHASLGKCLAESGKGQISRVAYEEALRRRDHPAWRQEMTILLKRLGLPSVEDTGLRPRGPRRTAHTSTPRQKEGGDDISTAATEACSSHATGSAAPSGVSVDGSQRGKATSDRLSAAVPVAPSPRSYSATGAVYGPVGLRLAAANK